MMLTQLMDTFSWWWWWACRRGAGKRSEASRDRGVKVGETAGNDEVQAREGKDGARFKALDRDENV